MRRCFLWVFTTWAFVAPVVGQNWPGFRGPNASGVGEGRTPSEWNIETGKNVRWKVAVPGLAHSSPIVWGDRIFLTTAVPQSEGEASLQKGWLEGTGDSAAEDFPWAWKTLCLSRTDGKQIWEAVAHTGVPKLKRHIKATHANSTPVTDGKHVVAFFGSEGLYCYDVDGKPLWNVDLGLLEVGPARTDMEWGVASSPIIYDGKVFIQCDARNAAFWASFDVATGKELRRVKREDDPTWCTPNIGVFGGHAQLICNGYKQIAGYDAESGDLLWTIREAGGDTVVPTPQVAHGLIYITAGHGQKASFMVRPEARGDSTTPSGLAWWKRGKGSYMPTPIIYGDLLYIGDDDGRVRCMDARDAKEHYAKRLSSSGTTFSASPVAADGRLYFTSEDGDVFVVKAGPEYELLATNTMGEVCMATPAISDGVLLVRTQRNLVALGE